MKNANVKKLIKQFDKRNIPIEEPLYSETGEICVVFPTKVADSEFAYKVVTVFSKDNSYVEVSSFNLVNVADSMRSQLLEVINCFNCEKRCGKLYLDSAGNISIVQTVFSVDKTFDAKGIMQIIVMLKDNIDEFFMTISTL